MPYGRQQVEAVLFRELERTKAAWRSEQTNFREIVAAIPSAGLPQPDGVALIKIAADRHNRALRDYRESLEEFSAFSVLRVVPERFKK
jgi:hypothetical protein